MVLLRAVAIAPPALPLETGVDHALAAIAAESPEVSADELLRIMWHESGGWRDARPGMRHWPHDARRFPRKRHYVCGVLQATAKTPAQCVAWQEDLALAYRAGADHMRTWHASCRAWGRRGSRRYRCARTGYALGVAAALNT